MLKNILKMIKGEPAPLARLRKSEAALVTDRATADQEFVRAKAQMDDAAHAIAEGGPEAVKLADDARAAQAAASKRLADIDDMLEATRRQIRAVESRQAAADDVRRHEAAGSVFSQREELALQLQVHLDAVAQLYAEMEMLRQQGIRLLPECRERMRMMPDGWKSDGDLRIAIDRRMLLVSNGLLGDPRALGIYTIEELRKVAQDIPATVAQTHRQFAGDLRREPEPEAA